MQFYVIGDRETVLGFRLAGIDGAVATGREAASSALRDAASKAGVGVVLITEKTAAEIRDEVDARLYGEGFPLVLEIPDRSGPAADRTRIEDIVRKAIGVEL